MKRIKLVLAVAAAMAVMMGNAVPAVAQGSCEDCYWWYYPCWWDCEPIPPEGED